MNELTEFLTERGYVRLQLTRSGVGHFHTSGTLNGREVEVLVDTGAACTVAAMSLAEEIGLETEWIDSGAGGAGGAMDQYRIDGAELRLGEFVPKLECLIGLNFESINAPLIAAGSREVDLILGVNVFDAHEAIIDYPSRSLFLKPLPGSTEPDDQ